MFADVQGRWTAPCWTPPGRALPSTPSTMSGSGSSALLFAGGAGARYTNDMYRLDDCGPLAEDSAAKLTTVKSVANDLVWQTVVILQLASRVGGGGGRGGVGQNPLHISTLPGSRRETGRGLAFPPLEVFMHPRERHDYRRPGILAVVWFGSSPIPPPHPTPSPVSKLYRRHTGRQKERQLADRKRGDGVREEPNHTRARKPGPP